MFLRSEMYNKTIIEFSFCDTIKVSVSGLPQP